MATKSPIESKSTKELQQERNISAMHPFENFERFFDDFLPNRWMYPFRRELPNFPEFTVFGKNRPKVDIIDRDNEVYIRADLPGIDKKNINISLTESSLTISGKCDAETKEEKGEYYCQETSHSEFERTLRLPAEVNADKASAVFKDGVLKLTIPKVKQCSRKKVEIQ